MDLCSTEFTFAPSVLELCSFSFSCTFYRRALQFHNFKKQHMRAMIPIANLNQNSTRATRGMKQTLAATGFM